VRCPACNCNNPEKTKCCAECGVSLVSRRPKCANDNPYGTKFCAECGFAPSASPTPVSEVAANGSATSSTSPEGRTAADGKRRHLTILFCDLICSSEIAGRLDREEWREIAAEDQRAGAEAAARFGGYLGDGLPVHFGYFFRQLFVWLCPTRENITGIAGGGLNS